MFGREKLQFKGFTESSPVAVVARDYNVITGSLADAVLERTSKAFGEQFSGFPGLEGTLRVIEANERKELAGSNMPVLSALHLVDLKDLGIQVCDERDLARIYNDETQRLAVGREGFFSGKFWFDVALIRNPHAAQKELMPWEADLNDEINALHVHHAFVSIPYRALIPNKFEKDNAPFGNISGYSFKINPTMKDAVRPLEITAQEAQEGYDFAALNEITAFPVRGLGAHFYGIPGNKLFSRLGVNRNLNANCDEYPLGSNGGGRVVVRSAEGVAKN